MPTASVGMAPIANENLLRFHDLAAHVMPAFRADDVRGHRRAALRAGIKFLGRLEIVRAAGTGPRVALAAFWDSHERTSLKWGVY
jgi:hypothetical protein